MKKLALILSFSTLLVGQAYGAILCPSICASIQEQQIENIKSPCHQSDKKENPKKEMPLGCDVMAFIDALSTFDFVNVQPVQPLAIETFDSIEYRSPLADRELITYGSTPPGVMRPIYILTHSFLI